LHGGALSRLASVCSPTAMLARLTKRDARSMQAAARLSEARVAPYPAQWELLRQTADHNARQGLLVEASTLYERLCVWEDLIECYAQSGRHRRAEAVLRARLAVAPTPRLWCLLGVVVDEDRPFEEAWKLSGRRNGRARIALGMRYLRRNQWAGAAALLHEGLQLDGQRAIEWFSLGAALMRLADEAKREARIAERRQREAEDAAAGHPPGGEGEVEGGASESKDSEESRRDDGTVLGSGHDHGIAVPSVVVTPASRSGP